MGRRVALERFNLFAFETENVTDELVLCSLTSFKLRVGKCHSLLSCSHMSRASDRDTKYMYSYVVH